MKNVFNKVMAALFIVAASQPMTHAMQASLATQTPVAMPGIMKRLQTVSSGAIYSGKAWAQAAYTHIINPRQTAQKLTQCLVGTARKHPVCATLAAVTLAGYSAYKAYSWWSWRQKSDFEKIMFHFDIKVSYRTQQRMAPLMCSFMRTVIKDKTIRVTPENVWEKMRIALEQEKPCFESYCAMYELLCEATKLIASKSNSDNVKPFFELKSKKMLNAEMQLSLQDPTRLILKEEGIDVAANDDVWAVLKAHLKKDLSSAELNSIVEKLTQAAQPLLDPVNPAASEQQHVGPIPAKLNFVIKQLNNPNGPMVGFKNRMILHGPPGCGKTMWSTKLAELTNRSFLQIDAPSIVTRYQGSGAEMITKKFSEIDDLIESEGKKAILFIDEIDAIASGNTSEHRSDHKAALQQLWLKIDKYKNNPDVFIVCATNKFTKLDKTFLDRFGNNVIEMKNPDSAMRKEIITYYFERVGITLSEKELTNLVKKTDGLSIRGLEDLASDARMAAEINNDGVATNDITLQTLKEIRKKVESNESDDHEWRTKLERAHLYIGIVGGSLAILAHLGFYGGSTVNFLKENLSRISLTPLAKAPQRIVTTLTK